MTVSSEPVVDRVGLALPAVLAPEMNLAWVLLSPLSERLWRPVSARVVDDIDAEARARVLEACEPSIVRPMTAASFHAGMTTATRGVAPISADGPRRNQCSPARPNW